MYKAKLTCTKGTAFFDFDGKSNDLWEYVGKTMQFVDGSDTLYINLGTRNAAVNKTFWPNGKSFKYSLMSDIEGLVPAIYPWKRLHRVDAATNKYDKYELIPHNLGDKTISFTINHGRYGAQATDLGAEKISSYQYPADLFWTKYYELINAGFIDMTEYFEQNKFRNPTIYRSGLEENKKEEVKEESKASTVFKTEKEHLYSILMSTTSIIMEALFDTSLLKANNPFSQKQIDSCRKIWNSLGSSKNVTEFNKKIEKLLALSPRRIDNYKGMTVKSFLAKEVKDPKEQAKIFADIVEREDSLIKIMEAMSMPQESETDKYEPSIFPEIDIELASDEEIAKVKALFHEDNSSSELATKIKNVWIVNPWNQSKVFSEYCKKNNITNTKLLFHGSRTENWISIISSKLLLDPNANINGKAYGYGIYFALSADKSFGYTSYQSARYNTGAKSSSGFMGIYETAYGISADPSEFDYSGSSQNAEKNLNAIHKNCLHAKAGRGMGFCRDEIIFYNEDATCMRYLVELG